MNKKNYFKTATQLQEWHGFTLKKGCIYGVTRGDTYFVVINQPHYDVIKEEYTYIVYFERSAEEYITDTYGHISTPKWHKVKATKGSVFNYVSSHEYKPSFMPTNKMQARIDRECKEYLDDKCDKKVDKMKSNLGYTPHGYIAPPSSKGELYAVSGTNRPDYGAWHKPSKSVISYVRTKEEKERIK